MLKKDLMSGHTPISKASGPTIAMFTSEFPWGSSRSLCFPCLPKRTPVGFTPVIVPDIYDMPQRTPVGFKGVVLPDIDVMTLKVICRSLPSTLATGPVI